MMGLNQDIRNGFKKVSEFVWVDVNGQHWKLSSQSTDPNCINLIIKQVEEERTHVAEVVSRLDNRMDRLEGLLDGKFMKGASSADGLLVVAGNNWPCLFLTAMALLLLAIALLVLCNTLLIRRLLLASTGIGTGTSGAAIENKREKKEVCGKQKGKERDQKEEKEQQQQRADTETMALVKKAEEGRI